MRPNRRDPAATASRLQQSVELQGRPALAIANIVFVTCHSTCTAGSWARCSSHIVWTPRQPQWLWLSGTSPAMQA